MEAWPSLRLPCQRAATTYFQQLEKDKFLRRLYVYSQFALITVDYGVRSGLLGTPHEAPFWRVFRAAWKFTTASLGASLAAI